MPKSLNLQSAEKITESGLWYAQTCRVVNINEKPRQKSIDCHCSFSNWCNIDFKKCMCIPYGVVNYLLNNSHTVPKERRDRSIVITLYP
uniref:AlNc14C375G11153 protein n=1 Tax=Albugo laibachii Nc14 TaxID=890382 RepID=F0WY93_9STRA|nr:AlNc14C375G11153 [Albugo laibachii Nc14]|eukprot:CCA26445.1 AlNc14C375G11153 [Albugo laibachii Nc14]